jgi:hypothetical protein
MKDMKWAEAATSIAGIVGVLAVLYLQVIDGLSPRVVGVAIVVIAGLGGYKVISEYIQIRQA